MAIQYANANTLLGVTIETREAIESMDKILIPGIDLARIGYQDLAQSLGAPGQFNNPELREATARVNTLCRERPGFVEERKSHAGSRRKNTRR